MDRIDLYTSVVPNRRQLIIQDMKYYAFVHYGINTFTNREWGNGKESETLYKYSDYAETLGEYNNTITPEDGALLRFAGYGFVRDMTAFCYDYGIAGILSVCPHYDASGSLSLANAIKEAMQ